ncbi:MAG: MarR family winged helix-turn-helix transcriptional regulator [Acidimicrobiales bacterium]
MARTDPVPDLGLGRIVAWMGRPLTQALRSLDLSDSQYRLLAFLADGESASTALAGRLEVTRPSITALVDGLVGRGFVERQADDEDRRRIRLTLTEAGIAALAEADRVVDRQLGHVLDQLSASERDQAIAATRLWGDALRALRDGRR